MKPNINNILATAAVAASLAIAANPAVAVPVNGGYMEDSRCDALLPRPLSHELGDVNFFPLNEAFQYIVQATPHVTVCVPDDGVANDWDVIIGNASGLYWQDLFFVADVNVKVGNADGSGVDLTGAPAILTDAFRIDGTVTAGINNNLLGESNVVDEIFEPGEIWRFKVSNFIDALGGSSAPAFATPGLFAGSAFPGPVNSNASILAVPVIPEPKTIVALGALALDC